MKLNEDIVSKIHVALGAASMCWDPLPHEQVFDSRRAERIGKELCDELAEVVSNDACGHALQKLWDEIIVARSPNYGDWEYPGQAYRHIKAEFSAVLTALETLLKMIDAGMLVRNTSNDHFSDWAIRQLPLIQALAKAKEAVRS
jgi:hypothetical protein